MRKAIVILGGILKKEKGEWRTGNLEENEVDKLRIIAANYLCQDDKNQFLIASGGNRWVKDNPDALLATVIKKELIERGVPVKRIIEENKSNNTYQQLQELKKIIIKQKLQQITIISNNYHLPRIKAMIRKNGKLNKMLTKNQLIIQSAEEIIIKHESKQEKVIRAAYKGKDMQKRIALEKKGIKDIKQGKYKWINS